MFGASAVQVVDQMNKKVDLTRLKNYLFSSKAPTKKQLLYEKFENIHGPEKALNAAFSILIKLTVEPSVKS